MAKENGQNGKHKGTIIALCASGLVIICLVVVIVVLLTRPDKEEEKERRNVVITPDNVAQMIEELEDEERTPLASYEVTMNPDWTFPDGTSASKDAYVENSVANTTPVYFDIVLADTGENIYSSPVLPIGSHLENITLTKDLDAGTYDCVIIYTLTDEEQNALSSVRLTMKITVEN